MNFKHIILATVITCSSYPLFAAAIEVTSSDSNITLQVSTYINQSWDTLTRQYADMLPAKTDSTLPTIKTLVYISNDEDLNKIKADLDKECSAEVAKNIEVKYLPKDISVIKEHGLLYLPYPYVVPGGRFNEMYGWDSYFIELGLLKDNRISMEKNMVDNLIYQVTHYGTILNANRTYYIERSHPPLLTEMVLAYYEKTKFLCGTLFCKQIASTCF